MWEYWYLWVLWALCCLPQWNVSNSSERAECIFIVYFMCLCFCFVSLNSSSFGAHSEKNPRTTAARVILDVHVYFDNHFISSQSAPNYYYLFSLSMNYWLIFRTEFGLVTFTHLVPFPLSNLVVVAELHEIRSVTPTNHDCGDLLPSPGAAVISSFLFSFSDCSRGNEKASAEGPYGKERPLALSVGPA